jgi:hypothetical protein
MNDIARAFSRLREKVREARMRVVSFRAWARNDRFIRRGSVRPGTAREVNCRADDDDARESGSDQSLPAAQRQPTAHLNDFNEDAIRRPVRFTGLFVFGANDAT